MKNRVRWAATPMWIAGAALVLSGCSYIPDWANPVEWYDNLFTDDGAAFLDAPREAGEGGFPVVADVPGAPPPVAAPAERQALAEGLAGDLENARYLEQQLRQGGAAEAAAVVAAAPQPAIAPAPVITPAPQPPAVPVAVVEAAPLPAPPAPVPAPGPVMPAAPVAPGLAEIGVPELAVPLPPGAAAAGLAVIAEAAPLPDLGAGLTPLLPALPPAGAVALAEPVPAPALNPALPAAAPAPAVAIAAPALVPALPAVPALPQMAAVAPPPTPGIAGAPLPAATPQQVAQVLPPAVGAGQNTLGATFAQMLQQSRATVSIVPAVAGFPAAPGPVFAPPAFNAGVPVAALETPPPPVGGGALAGLPGLAGFGGAQAFSAEPTRVLFGHDSASLSRQARTQIKQIADAFKQNGGTIRVVGHASQRTKEMAFDVHLRVNFRISANRAGAVAVELMRLGVDPGVLTIDAVGDAQPMYLEAMPSGEAKNRRVEIFVQA